MNLNSLWLSMLQYNRYNITVRKLNASVLLTKYVLEHGGLEEKHLHVLKIFWH